MAMTLQRGTTRQGSVLLIAGLIGFLVFSLRGQVCWGKDGKFSKKSEAASETKKKLINQELDILKAHPWAGKYYYGDGLGVNVHLSLAPKSGFVFTWNGCPG